jgi:hypothetical protein
MYMSIIFFMANVAQQGRRSRTLAALVLPFSLRLPACADPDRNV